MFRILVVEDDEDLLEMITAFLEAQGYHVAGAADGQQAYRLFETQEFQLVITDWMLPVLDGYQLAKMIRRRSAVPIIFLTAVEEETRQIAAYELQIDEYIVKPFSYNLLVKKVEAVLRRSYPESSLLKSGTLTLDPAARQVFDQGSEVQLTTREFDILQVFFENPGRVVTREQLIARVWQTDFMGDLHIVDTHIKNIRKKMPGISLTAVKGVGYRLEKD